MELRDYLLALRRYWTTWVGVTVAALVVALGVVLISPPSYQATAQVFVASLGEGTSGSQFVNQRVTSYPDVARSSAVLGPVIEELGLTESVAQLRSRVSASNPAETSQIDIAVTDADAERASVVANAVAEQFGGVVELLEKPGTDAAPVELTVTDPATVPSSPVSPAPGLLLPLGLMVGLALGAAAAVVRSRVDTRMYTGDDVRSAWGRDDELTVHTPAADRRRNPLAGRPVTLLARQLEPLAEDRTLSVVVLSPSADDEATARRLVDEVTAELTGWDVPVEVAATVSDTPAHPDRAGVQLAVGSPGTSLREWRRIGREHDGVVLAVESGRVDRAELREVRSILGAAGIRPLAVVVTPRRRGVRAAVDTPAALPTPAPPRPAPGARPAVPVPAGRR
jgi:capsular polysaccharide biosynthesis protein